MTIHTQALETIDSIINQIFSVIDMMEEISPGDNNWLASYKKNCSRIPDHIRSGLIKIAVVGVIKSGKSTFINSLAGKELVKRGAGVVTSITTRIRKGKKNKAVLVLKSWDDINNVIKKTLDMFPDDKQGSCGINTFDLRRKKDRVYLARVYDKLVKDFPVTTSGIRPEILLIGNALEGYETCKDIVGADQANILFSSKSFEKHKSFTSDPALAFYVKDVCLDVFGKAIDPNIEIADCQGADSIDPAQLSQVIKYIESANLIVYCISSRIGLRQSDIYFLKIIKRMGLIENILFVNNCDLTEHENLADLMHIESKIFKELTFLTPNPRLYSFSALYKFFYMVGSGLSKKNAKRLKLWQEDGKMIKYCNDNCNTFHQMLDTLLEKNHYDLLLSNHLERIRIMADVMDKKADIFYDFLCADLDGEKKAKGQLKEISANASRLKSIVDNSIEGAVSGLIKEIQLNLKKAFARDSINISKQVRKFIRQTSIDVAPYRSQIKETGFKQILYLMFQDFKRKIDLFALEQIVPELKKLIEIQENKIAVYFQSLLNSYQIDFLQLSTHMGRETKLFSEQLIKKDPGSVNVVDIQVIKKILGLKLPETIFTARYTTKMRANALTGLGLQSIIQLVSSLVDKHIRFSFTPGFDRAALKIKKESLASIQYQINLYHDRLNTLYFTPLIQAVTRDFKEKIHQRFALYESLNDEMEILFSLKQSEKVIQQEKICSIKNKINAITNGLDSVLSISNP
ncbi:MAG: dynamin family protein [Desulfobacteraceae bacterium]|nr:dynamin family protein [Desulfobacteraceae bacterium]